MRRTNRSLRLAPRSRGRCSGVLVGLLAMLAATLIMWAPGATPASAAPIGTLSYHGRVIGGPYDLATGPDGNIWFTNTEFEAISRMTPAGVVTNFDVPGIGAAIYITVGPDSNLWFTNGWSDSIGRITTAGTITMFTDPQIDSPGDIAAGADGNLWFTMADDDAIGRMTPAGVVTRFTDATIDSPRLITAGPDGNLWFTSSGKSTVGRITAAGVAAEFATPPATAPYGITGGPDGNVWFTDMAGASNSIGKITPAGVVTKYPLPNFREATGITTGPDGNIWFTSNFDASIGRITPAGDDIVVFPGFFTKNPLAITSGPGGKLWFTSSGSDWIGSMTTAGVVANHTGTSISRPYGIARGADGNMWFANSNGASIGRITPAGVVSSFTAAGLVRPYGITAGPDGNLWFTDYDGNGIGRITTAGVVTMFKVGPGIDHPHGIVAGPDGGLWFTNLAGNSIGRITTAGVVSNFTGAGVSSPTQITRGPDGALWFTNRGNASIGRITTAGVVSNFTGTGINGPYGIATGPDGNLWFTNSYGNSVGRITPLGVVSNFTAPQIAVPYDIVAGPDGNLWFTNFNNANVARMTTAGAVTAFNHYKVNQPFGIADGGDGTLWFTLQGNFSIGRITAANLTGAPTGVVGSPGNAQVAVSWAAPADNGGSPITGYTVTSSPGAKTCSTSGALTCTVTGLTNGTPYTFTVRATNGVGLGPVSVASAAVTPTAGSTLPGAPTAVSAVAAKQRATVSWSAPASNGGSPITAYTVSATPGGASCSTTGALTCAVTGLTAGTSYTFRVRATNAIGPGPLSAASAAVTPWDGSGYHAVTPERILDSRLPNKGFAGKVVAPTARSLQVTGLGGGSDVPASATAVVMNVTVADATDESFVTVYPTGTTKPNASNLNFGAGQIIPNLVTVKLGTGGKVEFANAVGATHVIADVVGYYDDGTGPGDLFTGITPVRLLDSRSATGVWNGPLPAGAPRDLVVRQPGNGLGVPATATAVVANVTVTGGTAQSFVSVWPAGVPQPGVSNLNLLPGQTIPNLVTVKIGSGGAIRIANAAGAVHVIVDVVGYFDPTAGSRFHAINPNRILDTRSNKGLSGPQTAGQTRALPVAGAAGTTVPTGATGLVANVTVADATAESFVAVFPGNVPRPNPFSNLNFAPGQVIPNLTAVGIAPNGSVNVYNHLGTTALIADAVGYYAPT